MKPALIVIGGVLLCTLSWAAMHRFEFHTGHNGELVYRCDRWTGSVRMSAGGGAWQLITEAKP